MRGRPARPRPGRTTRSSCYAQLKVLVWQRWLNSGRVRHTLAIAAGLAALLLLSACSSTSQNPQTAFNPRSDYATEGLDLFNGIIVAGVVVGVLVEIALVATAIRYRRRPGDQLPPHIHGSTVVEVIWTVGPVIIVGGILAATLPLIF